MLLSLVSYLFLSFLNLATILTNELCHTKLQQFHFHFSSCHSCLGERLVSLLLFSVIHLFHLPPPPYTSGETPFRPYVAFALFAQLGLSNMHHILLGFLLLSLGSLTSLVSSSTDSRDGTYNFSSLTSFSLFFLFVISLMHFKCG